MAVTSFWRGAGYLHDRFELERDPCLLTRCSTYQFSIKVGKMLLLLFRVKFCLLSFHSCLLAITLVINPLSPKITCQFLLDFFFIKNGQVGEADLHVVEVEFSSPPPHLSAATSHANTAKWTASFDSQITRITPTA